MADVTNRQPMKRPIQWRLSQGERVLILLIGDLVISSMALLFATYYWSQPDWLKFSLQFIEERIPSWFFISPIIWMLLLAELYDTRRASRISETLKGIGIAFTAGMGIYLLYFFISPPGTLPRLGVAAFLLSATLLTFLWRFIYIKIFTAPLFLRRVLIIGAGRSGSTIARVAHDMNPPPFTLIGFVDDDHTKTEFNVEGYSVLGNSDDLLDIIQAEGITDLIFAISGDISPTMFENVLQLVEHGVAVTTMPIAYEELLGRVPITMLQSDWLLRTFVDQANTGGFYELAKRLMDIFVSMIGVITLLVLMPFISVAIILDSGFPVFYSQDRLGKSGKKFEFLKYRTMYTDAEKDGKALVTVENDQRITRVGKILRKSHLDELPQFINVLRGDMSLVGPRAERPEIIEKLQLSVPFYRARLLVKPGITGWAQINFGYASSVEDTVIKMGYDLYYIKHRNLLLDISIILRTSGTVIGLRGQ